MREIKFRVYDGELKYMLDNPLVTFQGGRGFTVNGYPPEAANFYVMQYTGLKDKNGVAIYEADIIKYIPDGDPNEYTLEVKWSDYYARFDMVGSYSEYLWAISNKMGTGEIIGNIYENPELLEAPHGTPN